MKSKVFYAITAVLAAAVVLALAGQTPALTERWEIVDDDDSWCDDGWNENRESICEVRELVVKEHWDYITVDGCLNGGVSVEGWDRDDILIQAKVHALAGTYGDARELISEIEIKADRRGIRAEGPERHGRKSAWSVSYRLRVPRKSNLELETFNGGISIHDVDGEIYAVATNGGLKLSRLAGDVKARTTNGGLAVLLHGDSWRGRGLDVATTNGSVKLYIPEDYSAELEAGTVNGSVDVGFPITVRGRLTKKLRATIGDGGPTIRAATTNGGVILTRG